jgi:hypothetical protein
LIRQNNGKLLLARIMSSSWKRIQNFFWRRKEKKQYVWWLLSGSIFFLGAIFLLLFTPLFTPSVDKILPGENILFFSHIGAPICAAQTKEKMPHICQLRDTFISQFSGLEPEQIVPFSDSFAIAQYKNIFPSKNSFSPSLFFRIKDSKSTKDFILKQVGIDSAVEKREKGIKSFHFSYPQNKEILFWRGWLIITTEEDMREKLLSVKRGDVTSLSQHEEYQYLLKNSSPLKNSFIFFQSNTLEHILPSSATSFLQPIFDSFPHVLVNSIENKDSYSLQITAKNTFYKAETKNRKKTTDLSFALPQKDTVLVVGAENARQEIEEVFEHIGQNDPAFSYFLQGKLKNALSDFFGTEISLEYDILPMLEENTLIALIKREGKVPIPVLLGSIKDPEFANKKEQKIMHALKNVTAHFVPRVVTHTLEDGSEIREIAGCEGCIQELEESIGEANVHSFVAESETGEKKELTIGKYKHFFVVSTESSTVRKIMENIQSKEGIPTLLLNAPGIHKEKEFLLFYTEVLSHYPSLLPFSKYYSDFSLITASRSEGELFEIIFTGRN